MISKQKATESLGRLALLKWFPSGNGHALTELARILNDICTHDADADQLTDAILRDRDEWCGPKTLRDTMNTIHAAREAAERPQGCEICRGEPWVLTDRGADRCTCALGQWYRAGCQGRPKSSKGG